MVHRHPLVANASATPHSSVIIIFWAFIFSSASFLLVLHLSFPLENSAFLLFLYYFTYVDAKMLLARMYLLRFCSVFCWSFAFGCMFWPAFLSFDFTFVIYKSRLTETNHSCAAAFSAAFSATFSAASCTAINSDSIKDIVFLSIQVEGFTCTFPFPFPFVHRGKVWGERKMSQGVVLKPVLYSCFCIVRCVLNFPLKALPKRRCSMSLMVCGCVCAFCPKDQQKPFSQIIHFQLRVVETTIRREKHANKLNSKNWKEDLYKSGEFNTFKSKSFWKFPSNANISTTKWQIFEYWNKWNISKFFEEYLEIFV